MVQVINETNAGGRLGAALGTGLSSGIQNLSQLKLNELSERNKQAIKGQEIARQSKMFEASGYSPEQAWVLANFDPQTRGALIGQYEPQGNRKTESVQNLLGLAPKFEMPFQEQNQIRELLATLGQGQQYNQLFQSLSNPQQKLAIPQQTQSKSETEPQLISKTEIQPQGVFGESKQKRLERQQLEKESRIQQHELDKEANKETKAYYDSVLENAKEARESESRLNKMEKLVKKGNLPYSGFYTAFKNLEESISPAHGAAAGGALGAALGSVVPGIGTAIGGIAGSALGGLISPIGTLLRSIQKKTSPDLEEFEKLSNQFIKGAKAIFGARVTDNDLKAYMAQIPTLSNTDEGKLKIISDMKIANKAEEVREKHMRQIIKENGGKRPIDLREQVESRSKKELDKLSAEFLNV